MAKKIVILFLVMFILILVENNSFGGVLSLVDSEGSTTTTNIIEENKEPWIWEYMPNWPLGGMDTTQQYDLSLMKLSSPNIILDTLFFNTTVNYGNDSWLNFNQWEQVKSSGEWQINIKSRYLVGVTGTDPGYWTEWADFEPLQFIYVIPEPSSILLLSFGLLGLEFFRRKRH